MKFKCRIVVEVVERRSPCGERGLKYHCVTSHYRPLPSLPVRGAWIEIGALEATKKATQSLPVRGAWIEIASPSARSCFRRCRSPCGERGLKCTRSAADLRWSPSLPVRGAWIEIACCSATSSRWTSLPVRGAWIEIYCSGGVTVRRRGRSPCGERGLKSARRCRLRQLPESLPVRGAWIEIDSATPRRCSAACRSPCGERGLK